MKGWGDIKSYLAESDEFQSLLRDLKQEISCQRGISEGKLASGLAVDWINTEFR
jgi:hypothetical protein